MNDSADRKIILTVCVAVYNICDEFLRSCIESLISDKYENVEILLGDDGSRRQTADICAEYAKKDLRVRHIRREANSGVSVTRNIMIQSARGEWISFVDGDDAVLNGYSECLCNAAKEAEHTYDIIMYEWERFNGSVPPGKAVRVPPVPVPCRAARQFSEACLTGAPPHTEEYGITESTPSSVCNKMYRRGFLIENNLMFVPGIKKSQDVIFNTQAYFECKCLGYIPEKLYLYRKNSDSVTNRYSADFETVIRNCIKCDLYNLEHLFSGNAQTRRLWEKYKLTHYAMNNFALNFFHRGNPNKRSVRKNAFFGFVRSEPFKTFFKEFDFSAYEWHERRIILKLAASEKFGILDLMYHFPFSFKMYGKIMSVITKIHKRRV